MKENLVEELAIEAEEIEHHLIGELNGDEPGPLIIGIAGLHGNEPTGIHAIQEMIDLLKPYESELHGTFVGLKGNIPALETGARYIDEDMNRLWITSLLDKIRRKDRELLKTSERQQVKDLLEILDPLVIRDDDRKVILVDLHTFSGERGMFSITQREEAHIELLSQLKIPLIFGVEHTLHGTSMDFADEHGHIGFAFEAGSHGTDEAREHALAGLLVLMVASGFLNASTLPTYSQYYDYLMNQVNNLPHKVRFVYKHIVEEDDEFEMRPGFKNFDKVQFGDWLANDNCGKILAQANGYILMPLYQKQGVDGFFIVEDCP